MSQAPKLRIVSLESRSARELARLLERHGCEAISAPSMREVPLADQHEALSFGERLMAGEPEIVVLLTGVGTRALVDALATRWPRDEIVAALGRTQLVCRGPKPVAALKQLGLRASAVAPEPNTWQDLVSLLDREVPVRDRKVFVQEYGRSNPALLAALRERGALVHTVAVYAWAMPEDLAPLRAGLETLAGRAADVVIFTSARQCDHVLEVARSEGIEAALRSALASHVLVASIGPVTSEALRAADLPVDLEPVHPKMGHLVQAIVKEGPARLQQKRSAASSTST